MNRYRMSGKRGLIAEQTKKVLLAESRKISILDRYTYIIMTANIH